MEKWKLPIGFHILVCGLDQLTVHHATSFPSPGTKDLTRVVGRGAAPDGDIDALAGMLLWLDLDGLLAVRKNYGNIIPI